MRGWRIFRFAFAVGAMAVVMTGEASGPPPYHPDRILVRFNPGRVGARNPVLPLGVELQELKHRALQRRLAGKAVPALPDLREPMLCTVPAGMTVTGLVAVMQARGDVLYAEPDYVGEAGALPPDDPDFAVQWHHRNQTWSGGVAPADIRTLEAWDITTGSSNVIVAILDTGLTTNHPEFVGRTVPGYDFVNDDADPDDDRFHGTVVAGVLAMNGNNTNRGAGVDLQCRIMPVKVLDADGFGFYSDWASGIGYAALNGAKVINLSAGGSNTSSTLTWAIEQAIDAGLIFVTITHNDGTNYVRFPGRLAASITVGGTASNDTRYTRSNFGAGIDLVAPAYRVRSVNRANALYVGNGTSFAAPQVAGVCALLAALKPDITQDEARQLLCAGADDEVGSPSEDTRGFDDYFGWGRLNARATLDLALAAIDGIRATGDTATIVFNAPTNATARQPLIVETATHPDGTWSTSGVSAITYSLTSGAATISVPDAGPFTRLRVTPRP